MKKLIPIVWVVSFIASSCGMIPQKMERNGVRIEYKGVTKDEADQLLDFLAQEIGDGQTKDFKLTKEGEGYRIKMVVKTGFMDDPKNVELMNDFACEIQAKVYKGKLVTMDLTNDNWGVLTTVKSEGCDEFGMIDKERKVFSNLELYYGSTISEKERDDVGNYLTDVFGRTSDATFVIEKKDDKAILSIVVIDEKYYHDEEALNDYRIIACDIGKLLNMKGEVHMCDEYVKMKKVVKAEKCD